MATTVTIEKKEVKKIFDAKGNLFLSENGNIVITNGGVARSELHFSGTSLTDNDSEGIGSSSNAYLKRDFFPFKGTITITCD
jgi:hypothetical protein